MEMVVCREVNECAHIHITTHTPHTQHKAVVAAADDNIPASDLSGLTL